MRKTGWTGLVALILLVPACGAALPGASDVAAGRPATGAWARVLARHQHRGGLDYGALKADPADLETYLDSLAGARPEEWSEAEQKAFWGNAYNAVVVHFVLERYPGIASVKKVEGFFTTLRFPVAGEELTLDEIEKRARDLGDPRVHFAVVCASTSCPDLRHEPYRGEEVDRQLEEDARRFLDSPEKGLRYDEETNTLYLSAIFKWYAGDFTGGSTLVAYFARGKVVNWLLPHLPEHLAATLEDRDPTVRYLDYDWNLNDRPRASM
ncbi:MAG: DUF547 domain-containing protein [Thermoanaerobaculia bacterium]